MNRRHDIFTGLILALLMSLHSCQSCPENDTIGPFEIYPALDSLLVYNGFKTISYISSSGEKLEFEKYRNIHKEVRYTDTKKVKSCEQDQNIILPLYADIEFSEYYYATKNLDTLKFHYDPYVTSQFDMYYWNTYYKKIEFTRQGSRVFRKSRAQWEEQSSIDFHRTYLDTTFSLQEHHFDMVYYWQINPDEPNYLYFNDEFGLVGFNAFGKLWIRNLN